MKKANFMQYCNYSIFLLDFNIALLASADDPSIATKFILKHLLLPLQRFSIHIVWRSIYASHKRCLKILVYFEDLIYSRESTGMFTSHVRFLVCGFESENLWLQRIVGIKKIHWSDEVLVVCVVTITNLCPVYI